jgi:hypothetical protein
VVGVAEQGDVGVLGDHGGARDGEGRVEHGEGGALRGIAQLIDRWQRPGPHATSGMAAWTWSAVATLALATAAAKSVWCATPFTRRGRPAVAWKIVASTAAGSKSGNSVPARRSRCVTYTRQRRQVVADHYALAEGLVHRHADAPRSSVCPQKRRQSRLSESIA